MHASNSIEESLFQATFYNISQNLIIYLLLHKQFGVVPVVAISVPLDCHLFMSVDVNHYTLGKTPSL